MIVDIPDEVIEKYKKIASQETWTEDEDFDPCSSSGGNYDDAYYAGSDDGHTQAARALLQIIGVDWNG
jgi:hypothetical protein